MTPKTGDRIRIHFDNHPNHPEYYIEGIVCGVQRHIVQGNKSQTFYKLRDVHVDGQLIPGLWMFPFVPDNGDFIADE